MLADTIDLRKKKRDEIIALLSGKGYSIVDDDGEYKYLTRMPMDSVSEENVAKINREYEDKLDELERIKETSIHCMWLQDLDVLEKEYLIYKEERTCKQTGIATANIVKKKMTIVKKVVKKQTIKNDDKKEEEIIEITIPAKKVIKK